MYPPKLLALVIRATALTIGPIDAQERSGRSEAAQWAYEELSEAIIRGQIAEQWRILPRFVPDDVRAMAKRESTRARRNIPVAIVTCLVLFFLFVMPLFEREKAVVPDQPDAGKKGPAVHEV